MSELPLNSGDLPANLERRSLASQAYGRQGRQAAEEKWIVDNLPMVRHIALKLVPYLTDSVELDDLISAGTVGLVKAARVYDARKHAEFRTYAYLRIRGAIIDELRSRSFIPSGVYKEYKRVQALYQERLAAEGRPPGDEELAALAGLSREELYRLFQEARSRHFLSMHGLSEEESDAGNFVPPDRQPGPGQQLQRSELMGQLAGAIARLPKRERLIVLLYYERDLNMKEIAAALSITESRVSQLHAAVLFKLSSMMKSGTLHEQGHETSDEGRLEA